MNKVISNSRKYPRTLSGVIIVSTFFVFSSKTPFRILISSSRKGSSPVLWNWRNDLSSAFLYVVCSFAPKIQSRSFAIGHAIGAGARSSEMSQASGYREGRPKRTEQVHHCQDERCTGCADRQAIAYTDGLRNNSRRIGFGKYG